MPTNDISNPNVRDAERAKASLLSRVEILKDKLLDARQKLDLRPQITKHPLPAVGIAFVLGVIAGRVRTSLAAPAEPPRRSLTGAAFSALAGFGLRLIRDVALVQLGHAAQTWWTEHGAEPAAPARVTPHATTPHPHTTPRTSSTDPMKH